MSLGRKKFAEAQYEAVVLWWDLESLAVMCPFCGKVESHSSRSINGMNNWNEGLMFKALCSPPGLAYKPLFSLDNGLMWEKNWAHSSIDTIGLDLSDLDDRGSWDPTTFSVAGPPLGESEDLKKGNVAMKFPGSHLLSLRADQLPERENKGGQRKEKYNDSSISASESRTPSFSPRTVLGDMRLVISERKSNSITIFAPAATVDSVLLHGRPLATIISSRRLMRKTLAVLDRRGPFMPVFAISGWDGLRSNQGNNLLRPDLWTEQVKALGVYVTHKLGPHNMDHGTEGRFLASHAEKQLIAFFIRMHCFLEDGYEDVKMDKLNSRLPPHSGLREVWISTDKPACGDCVAFKEKVEAVCKVKIHFVVMQRRNEDAAEPQTLVRSKAAKLQPLTPPGSGSRSSEEWKYVDEEDQSEEEDNNGEEEGHLDNCFEDNEPESPCHQRSLRSLAGSRRPTTAKYVSYLSGDEAAFRIQIGKKRQRSDWSDDSYNDSEDEPGSSVTSSPARRDPLLVKSSRHTTTSALNSKRPLPLRVYDSPRTVAQKIQPKEQRLHNRNDWPSDDEKWAAINEVWESMEEQEQEEEASTDSDTPIAAWREGCKAFPIDLTGSTSEDGTDSEGSWYSP